jgi:hypothetical protein
MKGDEVIWYLTGENGQTTGPFATEDVLARCRTGDLGATVFCWRDVMDGWKSLAEVEPFSRVFFRLADEGVVQGLDGIENLFNKAINFTKRKAMTTSLHVAVGKHERRRQQLLGELGEVVYRCRHELNLLSREPYAEKLHQIKVEDDHVESLRRQIESIEGARDAARENED